MGSRAIRRHHQRRLFENRLRDREGVWRGLGEEDKKLLAAKAVDTKCPCSRRCCGNPRHHFHGAANVLTIQERRFFCALEE